jgi:hypothetical protein
VLLVLLFTGAKRFDVPEGEFCADWKVKSDSENHWTWGSNQYSSTGDISCNTFKDMCDDKEGNGLCYIDEHCMGSGDDRVCVTFKDLDDFRDTCLGKCKKHSWVHGTIMFNAFVFCQIFNEYNAKNIHSDWNVFSSVLENHMSVYVTIFTVGLQIILVEFGGEFMKTSPLTMNQWLVTILLGLGALPVGILMRFYPMEEDPDCFFDNSKIFKKKDVKSLV